MNINFNSDELELIQNKSLFNIKSSATHKTSVFLNEVDKLVRIKPDLVLKLGGTVSKITKGENLQGFPYFVLDIPKLNEGNSIFALRIIVWWGNYISVNLLLSETVYEEHKRKIIQNLSLIQANTLFLSLSENLWQHNVFQQEHYVKSNEVNAELLNNLKIFKIASIMDLNAVNDIEQVLKAVDLLNKLLL